MASVSEQLASRINFGSITKADDLKKSIVYTFSSYSLSIWFLYSNSKVLIQLHLKRSSREMLEVFSACSICFAGGALGRMTVFALNIMPYISASIIMQLLTVISPTLEQLKKEGEIGRKK